MNQGQMNKDKIKEEIDFDKLPRHIGIIMDGNGRWAKQRSLPRNLGHQEGMKRVIEIVEEVNNLGIKHLTLYAFSTENWKRPKDEVKGLMRILVIFIRRELNRLHRNNVKLNILGDISRLPKIARGEVKRALTTTESNSGMILNIALNYGGRDEIVSGIKNILKDINMGKVNIDDIEPEMFKNYLYTKNQPDPDLLIRPSGEKRISNFLLFQIAYTEFWFSNVLWPDFDKYKLYQAIVDYQKRDRRFGGI